MLKFCALLFINSLTILAIFLFPRKLRALDSTNVSVNHLLLNCKRVVPRDSTSNSRFVSTHRRNFSFREISPKTFLALSFLPYIRNNLCTRGNSISLHAIIALFSRRMIEVYGTLAEKKMNNEKPLVYQQLSIVYNSIIVVYLVSHLSTN